MCSSCLQRDFDTQIGLHAIQIATILAKYGKLNKELISRIFSVEFMDKLDDEIENGCPSENEQRLGRTSYYPRKVRRAMMNLNRIVCIKYPEYKIPWFHEKYCQEEVNNMRSVAFNDSEMAPIREDVYQTLIQVAGGYRNVRENVFSPYYHFIDFEVWLEQKDIIDGLPSPFINSGTFLPIGK